MKQRKSIFWLSRNQWISVAVLASSLGVAAAVNLHTFTAGTTISASTVNANFTALNNALPQVWASTDSGSEGINTSTPQTVNSVSITAPAAGHLMISGGAYVNNQTAAALIYNLVPQIDAVAPDGPGFAASLFTATDQGSSTSGSDTGTMAYTITVPVTAGAHTITQKIVALTTSGQNTTASFFYNANNMTVLYVPQISGFVAASSGAPTPAPERKAATLREELGL